MPANLGPALRVFNDRVKTMNQTGGKQVVLTATEARNLHAELFNLLALALPEPVRTQPSTPISLDGGKF